MRYYETLGTLFRARDLMNWEIWNGTDWVSYAIDKGSNLLTEVVEITEEEANLIQSEKGVAADGE
jgi:hypothetical protein